MSNDVSSIQEDFSGDVIARSASVPMVAEDKNPTITIKGPPNINKNLDLGSSRIRRFSSGSMIMSVSSPKISRLSPARLEQIKYEGLDTFVMQEIAQERANNHSLATCSNLANLMSKEWSMCDAETSSDASSSNESSSIAAASSLSSGIQTSGGVSPTVAKQFPSPFPVPSPSPPPFSLGTTTNRIRPTARCHKRSQSSKGLPMLTFSSSANASPTSSNASGGANSPTSMTPHNAPVPSLLRSTSFVRGSAKKRRIDAPSLFYHHTIPSASIGRNDPESPCAFRKSCLVLPNNNPSSSVNHKAASNTSKEIEEEECQPPKIKRPSSLISEAASCNSLSESESACSTPASSTSHSQTCKDMTRSNDVQTATTEGSSTTSGNRECANEV